MFCSRLELNSVNRSIPFGNEDMIAGVIGIKENEQIPHFSPTQSDV